MGSDEASGQVGREAHVGSPWTRRGLSKGRSRTAVRGVTDLPARPSSIFKRQGPSNVSRFTICRVRYIAGSFPGLFKEILMRRMLITLALVTLPLMASACGGGGPVDPNNTGPMGTMGNDMRVAAVDSSAVVP